jgi:surfactin synthase thioesterase subunit
LPPLSRHPGTGYSCKIIGHSLGGGTAALLAMMLREAGGPFVGVTCTAIACPSCMTLELAQSCADYVVRG